VTIYYVSNAGNDSSAGTTQDTAWLTLAKVQATTFKPGDQVLLRRGDTWFEMLVVPGTRTQNQAPLVFSCYGAGPIPNVSNHKIAASAGWQSAGGNLWTLDLTNNTKWTGYQLTTGEGRNVGHLRVDGVYKGAKKWTTGALAAQWDFHSDMSTGLLTVYSVGNPNTQGDDIRIAVGNRLIDGTVANEVTGAWISGINFDGVAGHGIGDALRDMTILGCKFQGIGGGHLTSDPDPNTRYGNGIQCGQSSRRVYAALNAITDVYDAAVTCQGETSGGTSGWAEVGFNFNEIARCEQAVEMYALADSGAWPGGSGFTQVGFRHNRCYDIGYGWSHDVRPDQNVGSPLLFYSMDAPVNDITVEGNEFYRFRGNFLRSGSGDDLPSGYTIGKNYVFGRSDQVIYNRGTAYTMSQWASFAAALGTGEDAIVQLLETGTASDVRTSLARMVNIAADSVARQNQMQAMAQELAGLVANVFGTVLGITQSILSGAGTPTAAGLTPDYIGQLYFDTTAAYKQLWYASGTSGTSDWKPALSVLYGAGPPNSGGTVITPSFKGQLFVDTTTNAMWQASGTSSSTDWRVFTTAQVNNAPPGEAPAYAGRIGVDTAGQRPYFSIGTGAIEDWVRGWTTYDTMLVLTDGATVTPNMNLGPAFSWTIGGNRTLANPSNLRAGDVWMIAITQDGTGSRTLSYGTLYQGENGYLPALSTGAGYVDVLHFEYDGVRILTRITRGVGNVAPSSRVVLTDAANISTNLFSGKQFQVTLAANRTLDNPTNARVGDKWSLKVVQDGTGSRTLTYGALYKFVGGTAPTLTTTAGRTDILNFEYDGTDITTTALLDVR